MNRRLIYLLGIVSCLTLLSYSWRDKYRFPAFFIRCGGVVAGIVFLIETSPKKWKTEQQANAIILTKEKDYLSQEREAIATEWENLENKINFAEQRFQEQLQNIQKEFDLAWQQKQEEYDFELGLLQKENSQLISKIIELNAIKYPKGTSRVEWVAAQVIDVFIEYDIAVDYKDSHALPGMDLIWVVPRQEVRVKKVKEVVEEIQLRLGLSTLPAMEIEAGCIRIDLSIASEKTKASNSKKIKIIEPNIGWFKEACSNTIHAFVNGDTGAGKSTLIANFVGAIKSIMGADVEVVIIDPKFPHSQWILDGEEIQPQFIGFDNLTDDMGNSYPSAIDGLRQLDADVRSRLSNDAREKLSGREVKPHRKRIYIVDEFEELCAEFGEEAAAPIRSAWRLARSSNISVIAIGQNPGCKAYRLEKANLRNAACFYLRENALKGIDEIVPTASAKSLLREQVLARQLAADTNPNARFYGLIKYPGKSAFIANMPTPGEYCFSEENDENISSTADIYDLVEEAKNARI